MTKIYLPALRGRIGSWAYYNCLMTFKDLVERVKTADEIHNSKCLSEYIQRELDSSRSKEISTYLITNQDRFFNSIVVAVYGGTPEWYQLDHLRNVINDDDDIKENISEQAISSIGFLSLSGEETLFALDGQHRLMGVKKSLENLPLECNDLSNEEISVIFVAHSKDEQGLKRTRRLFVDLNKTAKPVKKSEIIALDEADTMAIITRWLIEENSYFSEKRILISASTAMPAKNYSHWTNINNLYDVLGKLFIEVKNAENKANIKADKITKNRLSESELKLYLDYAQKYFDLLKDNFTELKEYFDSNEPETIVKKYRHEKGGSVLFRPLGLLVFTQIIASYIKAKNCSLQQAVKDVAKLNTNLASTPYSDTVWNTAEGKIIGNKKSLLIELLKYQLNLIDVKKENLIRKKLAEIKEIDIEEVTLPSKVV
ncbi:DGQHR domain-containing protein [Acinetobacter pittii]|uniref:DGQHR domain-containing protein n=1 Tax=Acinetobacter pittii TaxID=48296 RepID=UPI003009B622